MYVVSLNCDDQTKLLAELSESPFKVTHKKEEDETQKMIISGKDTDVDI